MPIFQPNFPIRKLANGPNDKAPIPVPAVTIPKMNRLKHRNPIPKRNVYH